MGAGVVKAPRRGARGAGGAVVTGSVTMYPHHDEHYETAFRSA